MIAPNAAYNPRISILNFNLNVNILSIGTDIILSVADFPSGNFWQSTTGTPDGTTQSPFGGPENRFNIEDRPFLMGAAIFSNLADGLIFNPSAGGGSLLELNYLNANVLNMSGNNAAITQPSVIQIPCLNTWFDCSQFSRTAVLNIIPPPITGTLTNQLLPYITFGGSGMFLKTDLIDAALNGMGVYFVVKVKVAHTFPMEN